MALSGEGILIADLRYADVPLVYVNKAFEEITGYPASEALGRNCRYLQGSDRLQPEITEIRAALAERRAVEVTLRNYRKNGSMFWNLLRLAPVFDPAGTATHYVGTIRDVTAMKNSEIELARAANLDPLTSIPTRIVFRERLDALLSAHPTREILLAKVDIARFHEINTSYSHDTGDALLVETAKRLGSLPDVLIGRTGGDVFAIAAAVEPGVEPAASVAVLHAMLNRKFVLPGAAIEVRFATGFTLRKPGDTALTLLRQAGVALHQSKSSPFLEVRQFDRATDDDIKGRRKLTHELQQAIENGDFILHYQPKVELHSGRILGAEALLRWQHPLFGIQMPGRFIAIAEQTALIHQIGGWALRETARFAAHVNANRADPLVFAVNVSPIQFIQPGFVEFVRQALTESGANPAALTLELTEGMLVDASEEMTKIFAELRAMGVGIAIDDFGTGYSSLSYLERFPLSEIKIDRCFVKELAGNSVRQLVVDAVIRIGGALNVPVIAEGIETPAEHAMLLEMGCPCGQGYLFGQPVDAGAFLGLVGEDTTGWRRLAP